MSWIKTDAWFRDKNISDDMWESFSEEQRERNIHLTPFRFLSSEVFAYNAAVDGSGVTLRFKNGYDIVVDMKLEQADKIFQSAVATG